MRTSDDTSPELCRVCSRTERRLSQLGALTFPDERVSMPRWRKPFTNPEIHALHAAAFETRLFDESEWDWVDQTDRYSLGWVVARYDDRFIGFVNVLWDGLVHAFIEDVMVNADYRNRSVGAGVVRAARDGALAAGCDFLHVGFEPTGGGPWN